MDSPPPPGDSGGECSGGLCGAPNQTGGGGCGGSILIAMTDRGNTYQFADDYDGDGIEDDFDNCAFVANGDQLDDDGDGVGSACDNCVNVPNFEQDDMNGNGIGDACDGDIDGDGIANIRDNCPRNFNPDQLDSDRDGSGDVCDSRFCIVFDRSNADACLDPATTFKAMSFDNQTANVGEDVLMRLFANRDNAAIRYTWTILNRPEGSSATIENPVGSVTYSSANEYRYLADQLPVLTPDAAGVYEIQLSTELVFADAQFPNNNTSRTTIKLTAEGDGGSSGCAAAPGKGNSLGLAMLFMTGALFLGRRRRS